MRRNKNRNFGEPVAPEAASVRFCLCEAVRVPAPSSKKIKVLLFYLLGFSGNEQVS